MARSDKGGLRSHYLQSTYEFHPSQGMRDQVGQPCHYTDAQPPGWSSKKEDSESFQSGTEQERALQKALCKNAAGAQGVLEPSVSFPWPLSTHGDR